MGLTTAQTTRLLVSACLLGEPVRYDGCGKGLENTGLNALLKQKRVIAFCPEVAGGLSIPRDAAEIQTSDGYAVLDNIGRVKTSKGDDVTEHFLQGARQALALCRQHQIKIAVLTELSPSCGSSQIYDGSFSRSLHRGVGVTTALLKQHGITVFSQHQISDAITLLNDCARYL